MATYTIKAGNHYSGFHFGLTFANHVGFTCTFDESCLYHLGNTDDYDINKLYGFSTTYNHHHQSARIGWRSLDGKRIEVLTYSYKDSVRDTNDCVLGVVLPGQSFHCTITDTEQTYEYTVTLDGATTTASNPKSPDKVWFKYLLYPFFGGNEPAPHTMKMTLIHD